MTVLIRAPTLELATKGVHVGDTQVQRYRPMAGPADPCLDKAPVRRLEHVT